MATRTIAPKRGIRNSRIVTGQSAAHYDAPAVPFRDTILRDLEMIGNDFKNHSLAVFDVALVVRLIGLDSKKPDMEMA